MVGCCLFLSRSETYRIVIPARCASSSCEWPFALRLSLRILLNASRIFWISAFSITAPLGNTVWQKQFSFYVLWCVFCTIVWIRLWENKALKLQDYFNTNVCVLYLLHTIRSIRDVFTHPFLYEQYSRPNTSKSALNWVRQIFCTCLYPDPYTWRTWVAPQRYQNLRVWCRRSMGAGYPYATWVRSFETCWYRRPETFQLKLTFWASGKQGNNSQCFATTLSITRSGAKN